MINNRAKLEMQSTYAFREQEYLIRNLGDKVCKDYPPFVFAIYAAGFCFRFFMLLQGGDRYGRLLFREIGYTNVNEGPGSKISFERALQATIVYHNMADFSKQRFIAWTIMGLHRFALSMLPTDSGASGRRLDSMKTTTSTGKQTRKN
jgi:hypothetical protein